MKYLKTLLLLSIFLFMNYFWSVAFPSEGYWFIWIMGGIAGFDIGCYFILESGRLRGKEE